MNEYIISDYELQQMSDIVGRTITPKDMAERITRCKDCELASWEPWVGDEIGHGRCARNKIGDARWIKFNGFCAWSEPKEES